MKTLLLSFAALFLAATTNAQNCVADFDVTNNGTDFTFNFTGNQPTNASINWYIGNQNYNGASVTTTINGPFMEIITCQVTLVDSVNNMFCSDMMTDTLFVPGSTNSYCSADFDLIQDSTSANDYYLINQSVTSSNIQSMMWDFGDGVFSYDPYPTHNYGNVGTYVISLFIYTDSCWSIATDTLEVTSKATGTWVYGIESMDVLSVENNNEFASAKLFPNPADGGNFTVSLTSSESKMVETRIISLSGQSIYANSSQLTPGNNSIKIDLDKLEKGIYLVIINDDSNNSKTMRLIID